MDQAGFPNKKQKAVILEKLLGYFFFFLPGEYFIESLRKQ